MVRTEEHVVGYYNTNNQNEILGQDAFWGGL